MILVEIVNDGTGDSEVASYRWKVYVTPKRGDLRALAFGDVKDFRRGRGWRELVGEVWESMERAEGKP